MTQLVRMSLTFILLLSSVSAMAYGERGHRVFCQVGYELASEATQQRLAELVAKQTDADDFASLCVWADEIKSDARWDWAKPHHYVNFSRNAATVKVNDCAPEGCILSALEHHYNVLKHNATNVDSLAFFAHFMGDLHQPLHVSFADDLGGNRARLSFYDEPTNLHRVWDHDLLMARSRAANDADWQAQAARYLALLNDQPLPAVRDNFIEWASESAAITRRIYSDFNAGENYGDGYVAEYGPLLERRLLEGAQRLARLLDEIYGRE